MALLSLSFSSFPIVVCLCWDIHVTEKEAEGIGYRTGYRYHQKPIIAGFLVPTLPHPVPSKYLDVFPHTCTTLSEIIMSKSLHSRTRGTLTNSHDLIVWRKREERSERDSLIVFVVKATHGASTLG